MLLIRGELLVVCWICCSGCVCVASGFLLVDDESVFMGERRVDSLWCCFVMIGFCLLLGIY